MGHCTNNPRKKQDTKPYILKKKKKKGTTPLASWQAQDAKSAAGQAQDNTSIAAAQVQLENCFFQKPHIKPHTPCFPHTQTYTHLVFPSSRGRLFSGSTSTELRAAAAAAPLGPRSPQGRRGTERQRSSVEGTAIPRCPRAARAGGLTLSD